jgi:transcriptional antiterminator RfaH
MSQAHWYVVQTQPNAERKAAAHLTRQGFQTYLPRYLKRRRHARRIDTISAPLFPRYLFVAVDVTSQRWRAIQSTVGVLRLICNGDVPAAVPDGIVEGIWSRENDKGFIDLDDRAKFRPGDEVRVLDGVFSASLGIVEGATDNQRVMILLELLGRKVRVSVDADLLVAA